MNSVRVFFVAFVVALLSPGGAFGQRSGERPEFLPPQYTRGLGLPFSEAVRVGNMLYLSGIVGVKRDTLELVPGGLEAEARQTLQHLGTVLKAAGASPEDVVKCTVMLEDIRQWSKFNEIYSEFFGTHRPARSALGVDGLALGAAVELECIAVLPR
jgi:2-iminobutanoate/2-iminopropanoate deaminase